MRYIGTQAIKWYQAREIAASPKIQNWGLILLHFLSVLIDVLVFTVQTMKSSYLVLKPCYNWF